ncbi:MAG TPA: hypothetical protein VFG73_02295 [Rhodanobacteraceae bacterium]|nr:hypothetical protein [Rhodanobacteraceae bacterium]
MGTLRKLVDDVVVPGDPGQPEKHASHDCPPSPRDPPDYTPHEPPPARETCFDYTFYPDGTYSVLAYFCDG